MKILMVADKENTAIHKLCEYTQRSNPQHDFRIVFVHPKRPNQMQLVSFEQGLEWCDLIDFRYWRSAELVHSMFPITKPSILTHYNPYDLTRANWGRYNINIVVNNAQNITLRQARVVPLPVDVHFWAMQSSGHFTEDRLNRVIMVANRIEAKKGILPVAQATDELGMHLMLVGSPSDKNYLNEVLKHKNVSYNEAITDEELRDLYHISGIHVCNSVDNFESGTMPILEAMSCGVPVLTRRVGHVPDMFNGSNMVVRTGAVDDVEEIKSRLLDMKSDLDYLKKLRESAWNTVKTRSLEIYGRIYSKMYWEIMNKDEETISVIIPTADRPESLKNVLANLAAVRNRKLEVIVCNDGFQIEATEQLVKAVREVTDLTIKYYDTAIFGNRYRNYDDYTKLYGLGRARNKAVLEAEGKWLLFLDDRLVTTYKDIDAFYNRRKKGTWLWGVKGGVKKGFVENFSFIDRESLINMGGFSEQISQYGGMTQELRTRAERNGIKFELVENAEAKPTQKSSSRGGRYSQIALSKAQCYKLLE